MVELDPEQEADPKTQTNVEAQPALASSSQPVAELDDVEPEQAHKTLPDLKKGAELGV